MKNGKIRMIIILIIILCLVVLALFLMNILNKKNKTSNIIGEIPVDYYNEYKEQRAAEGKTSADASAVLEDNVEKYYTVESIIINFNTYVNYLGATIDELDLFVPAGKENEALSEYRKKGISGINSMLANNYKKSMQITDNYLYTYLKDFTNKDYEINKMYKVEDSAYINTYFIYGNYNGTEFNFIIILDTYNYTYEIYLNDYFKEQKYSQEDLISMKTLGIEKIASNETNTFQYKVINKDQIASEYFNDYMNKMKKNPELAYTMLDSNYSSNRFGSINKFKQYIGDVINNKNIQIERVLSNYKVTQYDNYMEYVCVDNFGNNFIFKAKGFMNYTVLLDAYTVSVDSYENEYKEASDDKKVQLSLNRFIECLNNKDYDKAYQYLNNTFKQNNFKTEEDFKKYVIDKWFEVNKFSYTEIKKENNEYIITGVMRDGTISESYNQKNIASTFIVKAGNSIRDFEISFNVK